MHPLVIVCLPCAHSSPSCPPTMPLTVRLSSSSSSFPHDDLARLTLCSLSQAFWWMPSHASFSRTRATLIVRRCSFTLLIA